MTSPWQFPDRLHTTDGAARRVGIEIELQGIDVAELAELTANTLGGNVERVSSAEFAIDAPPLGEFRVEIDFALLRSLARGREAKSDGDKETLLDSAVQLLGDASTLLVPCEIVTPPIPMCELPEPMDRLVERLREAGGKGTRKSVLFAFGVHLNVEPPRLDATTALDYLRAFVCLYDWIVEAGEVDLSRKLTPYIQRFPKDYELQVVDKDYAPDWACLIDDYLAANPSRDRALDLLPLFAHVDEARVMAVIDDPLVKPRPAFHYRLANSLVDEPGWSIAEPWNRWVRIERLAADRERLFDCMRAFATDRDRMLRGIDKRWAREVTQWLDD